MKADVAHRSAADGRQGDKGVSRSLLPRRRLCTRQPLRERMDTKIVLPELAFGRTVRVGAEYSLRGEGQEVFWLHTQIVLQPRAVFQKATIPPLSVELPRRPTRHLLARDGARNRHAPARRTCHRQDRRTSRARVDQADQRTWARASPARHRHRWQRRIS